MTPRKDLEEVIEVSNDLLISLSHDSRGFDEVENMRADKRILAIKTLLSLAQQVLENGVGLSVNKLIEIIDNANPVCPDLATEETATAVHDAQMKGERV